MGKVKLIQYGSTKVTKLILYGSLCVSFVLTSFFINHDTRNGELTSYSIVGLCVIMYLLLCSLFALYKHYCIVSWLLILLYTILAFSILLYWGINAAAGIFSTSFVIVLSGILLGSRAILPVSIGVALSLFVIQAIHHQGILVPDLSALSTQATHIDVVLYISILGVFALITWLSNSQLENSLRRAKTAEATVRAQKESLATELEKESVRLRETQLKEVQQLYKFATLGQNVAATLHELSNHLSVLNMDIDDLKQQHRNSRAIANAKEGIEQINLMVRQIRRKLNNYDKPKAFKVDSIIRRVLKDFSEKSKSKSIKISYRPTTRETTKLSGDPLALTQILTVLIANALDACTDLPNAKVAVLLSSSQKALTISVKDNGIGVSKLATQTLFLPTLSSKPTGMGIGLYIARHLAESHFKGTIYLSSNSKSATSGAHFIVKLPYISEAKLI